MNIEDLPDEFLDTPHQSSTLIEADKIRNGTIRLRYDELPNIYHRYTHEAAERGYFISGIVDSDAEDHAKVFLSPLTKTVRTIEVEEPRFEFED